MREATLSTPDSPLVSLLSFCARRWFAVLLSSVLLLPVVWQMFRLPNFHFHSPVFENVCALKNALFCSFLLHVWKKSSTFVAVLQKRKYLSIKYTS